MNRQRRVVSVRFYIKVPAHWTHQEGRLSLVVTRARKA
jgi:hypothetical protein